MKTHLLSKILLISFLLFLIISNSMNLYAQGSGYALEFGATDDYVVIPSSSGDELNPQNAVTVESWIYLSVPASAAHRPHFIGKNGAYQLIIEVNGIPRFYARNSGTWYSATGTTALEAGKWYHIAGTFDGSNIRIYVNGKVEGAPTAMPAPIEQNPSDVLLGDRTGGAENLSGSMDEVRIWDVAKSEIELQTGMNMKLVGNESNLVGYWRLDDGSGTTATDLTSFANDGTLTNMDGSSDWITSIAPIGDASIFAESTDITETSGCEVDVVFGTGLNDPGSGYSLAAIQVNESPNSSTGLMYTIAGRYWEIWSEDIDFDDDFTASVRFHYDNISGIVDETDLVLYRRDSANITTWSSLSGITIVTNDGASSTTTDGIGYIQLDISETTPGGFGGQYILGWNVSPVAIDDNAGTAEDTPVVIDVLDNDTDSDGSLNPSTVTISGAPSNGSITNINASTGAITYAPNSNYSGPDQFSYTVNDNGGAPSNIATVSVTINPVNDLPVVTNIPGQTIAEGESFTTINLDNFVSDVEDADADITWTWSGNTDLTVTIDGSRIATIGIPDENWYGEEIITFTATDLDGGQDSDPATFTVTAVNDLPVVTNIPFQTINEGETFTTINLDNFVSDIEDADADITWTWSGNTNLTVTIDGSRIATIGIPDENWNGSEIITFIATDQNDGQDSDPATFTVIAVNDEPVVTDIPDQTVAEGETFSTISLDDFVSDVEDADADITWTWTGNTDLTVTIDGSRIATIGIPNESWYGNETITFTATDLEGDQGSDQATFMVTSVNDPPVVTDIPYQTIAEGDSFSIISMDEFVSDVEDADADISWTWSGNVDLTVTIDDNRIVTIDIPDENWYGSETITFTATDLDGGSANDTTTFTVNSVNDAPVVLAQIQDTSIVVLEEFMFQFDSLTFGDVDEGDTLSYSAALTTGDLPAWLSFDDSTRTFMGTPATEDEGTYNVVVTAYDLDSGSVADTFEIQVNYVAGLADLTEKWDLNVYPNPVRDIVHIELSSMVEYNNLEFHMYDITGNRIAIENRIIFNRNIVEIDLADKPAGMYILLVQNKGSAAKYKLMKL